MNPRIKKVKPNSNYTITLIFTNEEIKVFDVKPYLDKGIFKELKELRYFNSVKPSLGSVQWENGQDFCPDMLYEESIPWDKALNSGFVSVQPELEPDLVTV
ncbi:DUF2442 domain-containing protein [Anaerolineales bacterium HSG6]|nr:DUF2442 domain-containing protein [Anaerolineales bacterium HSG6]MDM8530903.1 DUF2442 domain-containing protein [Anaerolineales bacterium HSG25]